MGLLTAFGCVVWRQNDEPSFGDVQAEANAALDEGRPMREHRSPWPAEHPWVTGGATAVGVLVVGSLVVIAINSERRD